MASELAAADASGVVAVDSAGLAVYTPDAFVQAVRQIVEQHAPQYVVFPHTYQTRDFAPTLAAVMDRAIVTDVIGDQGAAGAPAFARPMFQGKLTADVAPGWRDPAFHQLPDRRVSRRCGEARRGGGSGDQRLGDD